VLLEDPGEALGVVGKILEAHRQSSRKETGSVPFIDIMMLSPGRGSPTPLLKRGVGNRDDRARKAEIAHQLDQPFSRRSFSGGSSPANSSTGSPRRALDEAVDDGAEHSECRARVRS